MNITDFQQRDNIFKEANRPKGKQNTNYRTKPPFGGAGSKMTNATNQQEPALK